MIEYLTSALARSRMLPRSRPARLDSAVPRLAFEKPGHFANLRESSLDFVRLRAVPAHFSIRAARNRAIDIVAQHETGLYTHILGPDCGAA